MCFLITLSSDFRVILHDKLSLLPWGIFFFFCRICSFEIIIFFWSTTARQANLLNSTTTYLISRRCSWRPVLNIDVILYMLYRLYLAYLQKLITAIPAQSSSRWCLPIMFYCLIKTTWQAFNRPHSGFKCYKWSRTKSYSTHNILISCVPFMVLS